MWVGIAGLLRPVVGWAWFGLVRAGLGLATVLLCCCLGWAGLGWFVCSLIVMVSFRWGASLGWFSARLGLFGSGCWAGLMLLGPIVGWAGFGLARVGFGLAAAVRLLGSVQMPAAAVELFGCAVVGFPLCFSPLGVLTSFCVGRSFGLLGRRFYGSWQLFFWLSF